MRRTILAAVLALIIIPAYATNTPNPCGNSGNNCNPDPPTTVTGEQNQAQDQLQGQLQGQAQGQGQGQIATGGAATGGTGVGLGVGVGLGGRGGAGGHAAGGAGGAGGNVDANIKGNNSLDSNIRNNNDSNAVATGGTSNAGAISGSQSAANVGDTTATGGAGGNSDSTAVAAGGAGGSADNAVSVDASNRSSTRNNVFVAGDLPGNSMVIAPGASVTVAGDQTCGMLQEKVEIPVYQWDKKGKRRWQVGTDEDVRPVFVNGVQKVFDVQPKPNGGYYKLGSHVTYALAAKGNSNGSQFGAQAGSAGGFGGIAYGRASSYSEVGVKIIIRSCLVEDVDPTPVLPVIEFSEPRTPRG